jgi:hypothetical protein
VEVHYSVTIWCYYAWTNYLGSRVAPLEIRNLARIQMKNTLLTLALSLASTGGVIGAQEPAPEPTPEVLDAVTQAKGETTEKAKAWLKKADAVLKEESSSWNFEMKVSVMAGMSQDDMEKLTISREGKVLHGGKLGTRIDSVNIMDFPGMPSPMRQKATMVLADGVYYVDRDPQMPMGEKERGKMTVEEAVALREEFKSSMSSPTMDGFFDPNPLLADPALTLNSILALCALDVAEENETQVILRGNGAMALDMSSMADPFSEPSGDGVVVTVIIDAKTSQPQSLTVGDTKEPAYSLKFSNFAAVEELDPASFKLGKEGYEWPSLAKIIREQMEMMMQMSGEGGGFDDGDDFGDNEF